MTYFLRYWKLGAAALLLSAAFSAGWYFNGLRLTAKLETERRQVAEDARALVEQAQQQAYEADEALRKAQQAAPKAAPKIREVTRANPSGCNVPVPVARVLRDAIRQGNAAVSR